MNMAQKLSINKARERLSDIVNEVNEKRGEYFY